MRILQLPVFQIIVFKPFGGIGITRRKSMKNETIKSLAQTAKRFGGSTAKTDHKVIIAFEKSTQTFFFPSHDYCRHFVMLAFGSVKELSAFLIVSNGSADAEQCVTLQKYA
jgi:hypothetical protein